MRRVPEQLVRLSVVFAVLIGGTAATYIWVIPASLTDTELHRSSTVSREVAKPLAYAGASVCKECHEDEHLLRVSGYHNTLACETCHGPLYGHSEDPLEVAATAPRQREFCPICHAYDAARPTGFPQIDAVRHNPVKPCIDCHDPHDPEPSEIPQECSACHARIFNTKAVSPHALLDCEVCHTAPDEHKTSPRLVSPTKPRDREFCGTCHGMDATRQGTPRVDLGTHEEKYLCWQCHFPHMPELDNASS